MQPDLQPPIQPQPPSQPQNPVNPPSLPQSPPQTQPLYHPDPPPAPKKNIAEHISAFFSHWFISWIIIPGVMVFILHSFVFSAYHVVGASMTPTLDNSDYLIVSKVEKSIAKLQGKTYIPKRNQVIVFHYPKDPTLDFVKRVVALPGERVTVKDCAVTVFNEENPNGFNPDVNHKIAGTCTEADDINEVIPSKTVFVLGDNRKPGGSSDSREWGFLPSSDIIGNAVLRLYPLDGVRIF